MSATKPPLHPPLTPIKGSSMLAGMHHDPDSRVLHVEFNNGSVYRYEDVGIDKVEALQGAKSVGGFFSNKIRPNHVFRRVK